MSLGSKVSAGLQYVSLVFPISCSAILQVHVQQCNIIQRASVRQILLSWAQRPSGLDSVRRTLDRVIRVRISPTPFHNVG